MKEDAREQYQFDLMLWAVVKEPNKKPPPLPRILKDG
jgi:hypothetical protein